MGLLSKLFGKSKKSGKKASASSDRAWQGGKTRGSRREDFTEVTMTK